MTSLHFIGVATVVMLGLCIAAPTQRENKIVRYETTQTETGSKFIYELEDGQFREEELFVLNKGTEDEEIAVIGSYSFWGTDDELYVTRYTADRNGYNAKTTHTPRNLVSTKSDAAQADAEIDVSENMKKF